MLFTFLGLTLLWMAGFQLCRLTLARFEPGTNRLLAAGSSFFISMALLILWITHVPLPLLVASWSAICIGAVIALPVFKDALNWSLLLAKARFTDQLRFRIPHACVISLILLHIFFVLASNLAQDIYPWDAFTTWMYRAKVWVFSDEILNLQTIDQWLQSGGDGYGIHASHYPASVSAIAAFSSALSGGWSDQLASLPWTFATVAIAGLMYGLSRQNGSSTLLSLFGSYLLISMPLVGMHGMLAGYADLWMLGTSGMGLAALLVWARNKASSTLMYSAGLLLAGCFIKTEGYIWLALGGGFTLVLFLYRQFQIKGLFLLAGFFTCIFFLENANLGELGKWGVDQGVIHIGPLGQYALRPYNPMGRYTDMIFFRSNFHLIGIFYLLALVLLTVKNWRQSGIYWLMGVLVASSQWVIFGLSSYSLYAETGTAINRLLLHFLPIFVVTVVSGWQAMAQGSNQCHARIERGVRGRFAQMTVASAILLASLSAPLLLLIDWSPRADGSQEAHYPAEYLVPVLGTMSRLDNNRQQFTSTKGPVAVAKVRLKNPGAVQPRYVIPNVWMTTPETVSFYWIIEGSSQVNSYSLDVSGPVIIDMQSIPAYWEKSVSEMGYLIKKSALSEVQLGRLTLTDSIRLDNLSSIVNHWLTPDIVSQRSINWLNGHLLSPVMWETWLFTAILFGLILIPVAARFLPASIFSTYAMLAVTLWLASDLMSLTSALSTARQRQTEETGSIGLKNNAASNNLLVIADKISSGGAGVEPVVIIALDQSSQFQAQKLPLLLAPQPAVTTHLSHAVSFDGEWQGQVILFSSDKVLLEEAAKAITSKMRVHAATLGGDYLILKPATL